MNSELPNSLRFDSIGRFGLGMKSVSSTIEQAGRQAPKRCEFCLYLPVNVYFSLERHELLSEKRPAGRPALLRTRIYADAVCAALFEAGDMRGLCRRWTLVYEEPPSNVTKANWLAAYNHRQGGPALLANSRDR